MDNAIHIQLQDEVSELAEGRGQPLGFGRFAHIEAIEFGNPVLGNELRDGRVAL
jgi:hypothetical protein